MRTRQLGKDGPLVGAIGVGCWSFAGAYGSTTERESHEVLARALDFGANHWDTADTYGFGAGEEVIGRFLKGRKDAKVVLATKGGIKRRPGTTERNFDSSPDYLRSALEASLRRLGRDHVDLYYVHRREPSRPVEEITQTLARFVKEGKARAIGFSEIAPATLRRASTVHRIAAVESEYSLWSRQPELGLVQACRELGVALVAFSPLGRGFLTGTVERTDGFGPLDFRKTNPRFLEPSFSANKRALKPFLALAREKDVRPAQLALAWLLAKGQHVIPIPGTRSLGHLDENLRAASVHLSDDDLAAIERALPVGFAHGDRYSELQWPGAERYS
jgi:aryl-alcohol dehydrogenase-like predicted oxidoreductase